MQAARNKPRRATLPTPNTASLCRVGSYPRVTSWCQPPPRMLALRVSALDRLLGRNVESLDDLLRVQDLIMSRQRTARHAVESADAYGEAWPRYLVDPIGALGCWPRPYRETPTIAA